MAAHFRHSYFDDCSVLRPKDYGASEGAGFAYGHRIAFGRRGDDHGIGGGNFAVGIVKRSYHCDDVREPRFGICARQFALAAAGTDKSYFERTVATFGTGKIDQSFKLLDAFQTAHGHVSAHARTSRRH